MPVSEKDPIAPAPRRPWEPPAGKKVGTVGELLQGGMGKLSPAPKDPGEDRKVPAQDGG
jgi:hypothetical protein